MTKKTCGNCEHYLEFMGESRGNCTYNPPIALSNGDSKQPIVIRSRPRCSKWKESTSLMPEVKTKDQLPTHGQILQDQQRSKKK